VEASRAQTISKQSFVARNHRDSTLLQRRESGMPDRVSSARTWHIGSACVHIRVSSDRNSPRADIMARAKHTMSLSITNAALFNCRFYKDWQIHEKSDVSHWQILRKIFPHFFEIVLCNV
jgi:hypothetical protein